MKVTLTLDDNLLKEAAELTGINETELIVQKAVSEFVKLQLRREMLKLKDSGIWDNPLYVRERVNV